MQKVAIRLRDLIEEVDLIVTSPYIRARQTADILLETFPRTRVMEAPELVPQSPPQAFLRWLKAHARDRRAVMAVGHEPQLSVFASYLLCGKSESLLELKKSGALCLEVDESEEGLEAFAAELQWLLPPRIWVD